MHRLPVCLLFSILFLPLSVFAQRYAAADSSVALDEIVVTSTVVPVDASKVGNSVTVITAEEIAERNPTSLEDLFRAIPSLSVASTGMNVMSIGIRGAVSGHTMVLIDGVPYSDPAGTSLTANINTLPPSVIERIEILKGPASAMYGSGAMAGVINIITKKGAQTSVRGLAGSYGAYGYGGSFSHELFTIAGDYYQEDGISALSAGTEKDPYKATSLFLKHNYSYNKYSHSFMVLYNKSKVDYDDGFDPVTYASTDSDAFVDTMQTTANFKASYEVADFWMPSVLLGITSTERESGNTDYYLYKGRTEYAELNNYIFLPLSLTLALGGKYTRDEADNRGDVTDWYTGVITREYLFKGKTSDSAEFFLNAHFNPIEDWNIFGGGRYTDTDGFGSKMTYSVSTSYLISPINLTARAAYGTSFLAPLLHQLYEPTYGNEDLKAETGTSWEGGLSWTLFDRMINMGVTYFDSKYENKIGYRPVTYEYYNAHWYTTKGIEANLSVRLFDVASLGASYTYADAREKQSDGSKAHMLRRPYNKAAGSITAYAMDGLVATFEVVYVGDAEDFGGKTGDYTLLNLYGVYQLSEKISINGKVMNLTDVEYESAYGYGTKGINVQVGADYRF